MTVIELTYIKPLSEVDNYLAEHRAFLSDAYDKKLLMVSGPQMPRKGGVIISNESKSYLAEFIKQDPFYKNNIAQYRFIEFDAVLSDPEQCKINQEN